MKLKNRAKEKVEKLIKEIEILQQRLGNEKLESTLKDVKELVEHNEFGIALENLLTNLYEFEIAISYKQLEITRTAIQAMNLDWGEWSFIEELNQKA